MPLDTTNRTPAAADGRISVALAHADAIVCAGLSALLGACGELRVAPADAPMTPDAGAAVLIFDYRGGMDYLRRGAGSAQRVLIVTPPGRGWELHAALTAGAHGYLLQSADAAQVRAAVRAVGRGERYVSDDLGIRVDDRLARSSLTGREHDVLQRLAHGDCNKQIARSLGIGVGTVKTHVKGLCDKLGASTRTQVVVLAIRRGLVGAAALTPIFPAQAVGGQ